MPSPKALYSWQRWLNRFFQRMSTELTIGFLILLSVALTLIEFTGSLQSTRRAGPRMEAVATLNTALTWLFVIELTLRYLALMRPRRFFREYWIDCVAVLPSLLPDAGMTRVMRVIRLLRILRLFGFVSRVSSSFPYILRKGSVEFVTVCGLLLLTVLIATGAMLFFEPSGNARDAFWFSLYSLFAGEPVPDEPRTVGGRIVSVAVMFMGVTIFAMYTGTVAAFMVERLRMRGRVVDWEQLHDHVIVCGWNRKAEIILKEFTASHLSPETPMVVITEWEHEPPHLPPALRNAVLFLQDDFTRVDALEQAGIHRARICILLSDTGSSRSEQDADARTILAALTVEKLNPDVYTCAELNNAEYGPHLQMGHVNDYVVSSEYNAYLLAQAALNRGLMGVYNELLTYQRGNQFYRVAIPPNWVGRDYAALFGELKERENAVLIAVYPRENQGVAVNPTTYRFEEGDDIVVIADHEPELT